MDRIEEIAKTHPAGIILREKDLTEEEYRELAKQVLSICQKYQVPCMLHSFVDVALDLKTGAIHLPLPVLRSLSEEKKQGFSVLGASCHSEEEAREAELLGCTYVVAGHIFTTDCKKGLPGRGTGFLQKVCKAVRIPVYAIGGITAENIGMARETGAAVACVMSGLMQCGNVEEFMKSC